MRSFIKNGCDVAATLSFVREHDRDDVRRLALQASRYPGVDMRWALDQIAGRQTARVKLPMWAAVDGIVYPPHVSMEQCSSQATAQYKCGLVTAGGTLVDLTGGLGVDFSFLARQASQATYVERDAALCRLAQHNFAELGLSHARVVNASAEDYLEEMDAVDCIYLDPSRRDHAGHRVYALADCSPDVTVLATALLLKAPHVLVKLSPMLDIALVARSLPHVSRVHVVATSGECKELLVELRRDHEAGVTVVCVNDAERLEYDFGAASPPVAPWGGTLFASTYLYEPNAALMKAGCHTLLAHRYGLLPVSHDSHLLVSARQVPDFPGRCLAVRAMTTMNKGDLRRHLQGVTQANVMVRNFPLKAPELARRLRLSDGGDHYVVGTRLANGRPVLFIAHRCE